MLDSYHIACSLRSQLEWMWRKQQDTVEQIKAPQANCLVQPTGQQKQGFINYTNLITANSDNPKKLWEYLRNLLHCNSETILPTHVTDKSLTDKFAVFFCKKISKIRGTFPTSGSSTNAPTLAPPAFNAFESLSEDEVCNIISASPTKSCLLNPIPYIPPQGLS